MDAESKTCSKCKTVKPIMEFSRKSSSTDGRNSNCKACDKNWFKKYYSQNKEKRVKASADYQSKNKEKTKQHKKKYRDANKEKLNEQKRSYDKAHADDRRKRQAAWVSLNKDKQAEMQKRCRDKRASAISLGYIAGCLGVKISDVTKEIAQFKREQLTVYRLSRQLKKAANEIIKDPC